jgi:hypothetical protein
VVNIKKTEMIGNTVNEEALVEFEGLMLGWRIPVLEWLKLITVAHILKKKLGPHFNKYREEVFSDGT